jgi:hypothetical protein
MNLSKLEEILNPYENSIDDLEKKFSELVESCYEDTYLDNDTFDYERKFLKTKEEVISEFLRLGLSDEDAIKAEQALQMSKDEQYDESLNESNNLVSEFESELSSVFDNMLKDLDVEDDEDKIKNDGN